MTTCSPFLSLNTGKRKGHRWTLLLLCLWTINATACNFAAPKSPAEPPPENIRKPLATSVSVQEARDLAKPARQSDGFEASPDISIIGDKSQMMGLKTQTLFSDNVSNDEARFTRLENAVQEMHYDFEEIKPSIKKLVSIEKDLDDLMQQLDALVSNEPVTPRDRTPLALTPQSQDIPPAKKVTKTDVKTKTAQTPIKKLPDIDRSKAIIHSLRLADHSGKTRLVIETTQHLPFDASLDNQENLLTLAFEKGAPAFDPTGLSRKSKLVNAITTADSQNGALVIVELAKSSNILQKGRIKPNKDNAYHRIFIDLER